MKYLCKGYMNFFGPSMDTFFVTKLQNCESEHDHGILWIVDAPIYGIDSNKTIEDIVDRCITCDSDKLTPNLCETQTHCHKKKPVGRNQAICCFNFPWSPWKKQNFVEPLPVEILSLLERKSLSEISNKILMNLIKFTKQNQGGKIVKGARGAKVKIHFKDYI
jgi:hypothetical protein